MKSPRVTEDGRNSMSDALNQHERGLGGLARQAASSRDVLPWNRGLVLFHTRFPGGVLHNGPRRLTATKNKGQRGAKDTGEDSA